MNEYILTADIGGSHISSAIVHLPSWEISESKSHKTNPLMTKGELIATWINNLKQSQKTQGSGKLKKLTIAIPGPINYDTGEVLKHPKGKFSVLTGSNLKVLLSQVLEIPSHSIHLANDAQCFGIGESYFGLAKSYQRIIAITLGTGIGASFIDQHKAITNREDVTKGGELYQQPWAGDIADIAFSTSWFLAEAKNNYGIEVEGVKELIQTVDQNTLNAIFQSFSTNLHQFLLPYALIFKAEAIVFGGNISQAWPHFGKELELSFAKDGIKVFPTAIQEKAILLGAAKLGEAN